MSQFHDVVASNMAELGRRFGLTESYRQTGEYEEVIAFSKRAVRVTFAYEPRPFNAIFVSISDPTGGIPVRMDVLDIIRLRSAPDAAPPVSNRLFPFNVIDIIQWFIEMLIQYCEPELTGDLSVWKRVEEAQKARALEWGRRIEAMRRERGHLPMQSALELDGVQDE
jgi:hypothetical protein